MKDLAVIIPTRGRPDNICEVIEAWDFTNAWDYADMILVVDADDPEYGDYRLYSAEARHHGRSVNMVEMAEWMPMVHKLNAAAETLSRRYDSGPDAGYFALGFAGDDHLPRTIGWAARYLTVLREMGSGMVYGDDGYQGAKLSTEWAVTSDCVRALGRMVPAAVEHMYCDNAMMDLFGGAGALRHLPEVRIEHMHPVVGKAETDAQYQRVNHRDQYAKDGRAYNAWRHGERFKIEVAEIRHLRKGRPDVEAPKKARNVVGSGPRPAPRRGREVQRSGPSARANRGGSRPPRHFANVRAATPEDVMMALADLAAQVPAGQEIVELGVFQGRTALQLAWGSEQGNGNHVTAIDPWDMDGNVYDPPFTDPGSRMQAFANIENLGYADKIQLIHNFSEGVAENWEALNGTLKVGLLYVDGDHTYEGARRDIEAWAPHLAPGARIAVDDYGHPDWPGVGQAVDDLVAEGFLEPIEIYHDRLAVTRLADVIERTDPMPTPTAITSEGVSPSPYPAVAGQVADDQTVDLGAPSTVIDSDVSISRGAVQAAGREYVSAGELEGISGGTSIEDLNLPYLKSLAKARGIVLGARKDKRAEILQALRDGK